MQRNLGHSWWPHKKCSLKSFESNQCVRRKFNLTVCAKTSPETLFRSPKGPMTNKSPRKDEVRVIIKEKILYQGVKIIPMGVLRHTQIPKDINKWKIPTSKFGHFWKKTLDLPLGTKLIFGRNTNVPFKGSNRIRVSENVPWESF